MFRLRHLHCHRVAYLHGFQLAHRPPSVADAPSCHLDDSQSTRILRQETTAHAGNAQGVGPLLGEYIHSDRASGDHVHVFPIEALGVSVVVPREPPFTAGPMERVQDGQALWRSPVEVGVGLVDVPYEGGDMGEGQQHGSQIILIMEEREVGRGGGEGSSDIVCVCVWRIWNVVGIINYLIINIIMTGLSNLSHIIIN